MKDETALPWIIFILIVGAWLLLSGQLGSGIFLFCGGIHFLIAWNRGVPKEDMST
jgi:hypothetical protein